MQSRFSLVLASLAALLFTSPAVAQRAEPQGSPIVLAQADRGDRCRGNNRRCGNMDRAKKRQGERAGRSNRAEQKRALQQRAGQKKAIQKRAGQKNAVQKRAAQKAVQQRAGQKKAVQKRAAQKKVVQKRAAQKKAVQKRAVQKLATQKRAAQKKAVQQRAQKRAAKQGAAPKKAVQQRAARKKAAQNEAAPRRAKQQRRAEQRDAKQAKQAERAKKRREVLKERRAAAKKPAQPQSAKAKQEAREKLRDARQRRRAAQKQQPAKARKAEQREQNKLEQLRETRKEYIERSRAQRLKELGVIDELPKEVRRRQSNLERVLEARGSGDEARQIRKLREKLRDRKRAERREARDDKRRWRADRDDRSDRRRKRFVRRHGDRDIFRVGVRLFVEPREYDDRLLYGARDIDVDYLGDGRIRTTVYRGDGSRIVTVRDAYGDIITCIRYLPHGDAVVLIDNRYYEAPPPYLYEEVSLPPMVVAIPEEEYIVEAQSASQVEVHTALAAPPVEAVERPYTVEEIRQSDRLRDKVRRVDLDTITFDFGSAVIGTEELDSLDKVGEALEEIIEKSPDEVFLIEGHTDAVGSDEANLVLSDERAEAVAVALAQDFVIPPENLVTQGYGEQFLKVPTDGPARENRRVTVRRITPLLREEAAQAQ